MKNISLPTFIRLVTNAGIELDDTKKKLLTSEFLNYKEPTKSRMDTRILMIRALVAKGISASQICKKLQIQRYQVYTALDRRKSIKDDQDWTTDQIRQSEEYKTMTWSHDEFEYIITKPSKGHFFDYNNLKEFKNELVV